MKKFILITGTSGGIGSAIVDVFLSNEYNVIGIDKIHSGRKIDNFIEIKTDLHELSKNKSYKEKKFKQIKDNLPNKLDHLVLINNAAVQILKPVPNISIDHWDMTLSVNVVAPFILAQGLIEELKHAKGHIINVSSIHSRLTKKDFTCYAASKSALESLTRSLAIELSPKGISVNAVSPSAISTQMLLDGFKSSPNKLKGLNRYHPAGSIGSPEELAIFIKSITDQKGRFLTGSILEYSGGIGGCLHDPI